MNKDKFWKTVNAPYKLLLFNLTAYKCRLDEIVWKIDNGLFWRDIYEKR
jgi:hypothetical protein